MTRPTFEERLADPAGHFPYKHEQALNAVGDDPAAVAEVNATAEYVQAQAAYFGDPTPENRAAEREAADWLRVVRQARRNFREAPEGTPEADDAAAHLADILRGETTEG